MSIRILRIPGRKPQTRMDQLERINAWMEDAGWRMENYLEAEGSALFVRDEDAAPLGRLHPTRWLPGPGMANPREWVRHLMGVPHRMLTLGVIILLGVGIARAVLHPPDFLTRDMDRATQSIAGQHGGENWKYVNASSLNVRELPNANAITVGVLYRNQRVLVERIEGDWAQLAKPERGFVAREFIQDAPAN